MDKVDSISDLESLIGRNVRIFKGGPESRKGLLMGAAPEYLILQTKEEGIVYYQSQHVKSVIDNTRENQIEEIAKSDSVFIFAETFNQLLEKLVNKSVSIDRGGPQSRKGHLLAVFDDYLALQTEEEGILYYQTQHVKSISEIPALKIAKEANRSNQALIRAVEFKDLLDELQYKWVQINREGPESIEGILVAAQDENLVVTSHHDVNWITTAHIYNISLGLFQKEKGKDENNKGDNSKGDNNKGDNNKGDKGKDDRKQSKQNGDHDHRDEKRSQSAQKSNPRNSSRKSRGYSQPRPKMII